MSFTWGHFYTLLIELQKPVTLCKLFLEKRALGEIKYKSRLGDNIFLFNLNEEVHLAVESGFTGRKDSFNPSWVHSAMELGFIGRKDSFNHHVVGGNISQ